MKNMKRREYYWRHRERELEKNRAYRLTHKDYFKRWALIHGEQMRASMRKYEIAHREERNARQRTPEYRARMKPYKKKYFELHKEKILADDQKAHRRRRFIQKIEVLTHYSNGQHPHCMCCGENNIFFLTLDHINGGGNAERRKIGKGKTISARTFYKYLKISGYPSGLQVLCFNCNTAKGFCGICPHQGLNENWKELYEKVFNHV